MMGFMNVAVAGFCSVSLMFSGLAGFVPKQVSSYVESTKEDVLGDYISGVDKDTRQFVYDLALEVDKYVNGNNKALNDFLKNPNPITAKKFAYEMKRRAHSFADVMEAVSEAYGRVQEINGDAFGDKFDDETAKTIVNIAINLLKTRK